MKTISLHKKKNIFMLLLMVFCLIITIYFERIGVDTIYTHLFYIPIVISCIWWHKKGIFVAGFLGIILISTHILFNHETPIFDDALRSFIFIVIAILVAKISIMEKQKTLLLEEEKIKVEHSYLGLVLKNNDLERKEEIIKNKEKQIEDLEKQIKALQNSDQ